MGLPWAQHQCPVICRVLGKFRGHHLGRLTLTLVPFHRHARPALGPGPKALASAGLWEKPCTLRTKKAYQCSLELKPEKRGPHPRCHAVAAELLPFFLAFSGFCFSREYLDVNLPWIWITLGLHVKAPFLHQDGPPRSPCPLAWGFKWHLRPITAALGREAGTGLHLLSIRVDKVYGALHTCYFIESSPLPCIIDKATNI